MSWQPDLLISRGKKSTPYPLPAGEGQVNTPINHLNQGEGSIISLNHATQLSITTEKESTLYPLPAGEGQTDTPINHHNQGEGGIISLTHATQLFITTEKDSTPYPLPAGEGQVNTPINHHNQGEVFMTARIEKSVFISYRRTNLPWALAIYQELTYHGYDVFFDYLSIPSGDFENIIVENIRGRAHFVVILTPSALERCNEPGDWLRREIETAMDEKRNIVPLMLESFDFGSPATVTALTGKLEKLKKYNGLRLHSEYFFEGMNRLREQYLNVTLESVIHPISEIAKPITEEHQIAASEALPVAQEILSAQEWFERGVNIVDNDEEEIRCYNEAIRLDPNFTKAYTFRGLAYSSQKNFDKAMSDFETAIHLQPGGESGYVGRGLLRRLNEDFVGAIQDFDEAIRLAPNEALIYNYRGTARRRNNDLRGALADYNETIRLSPNFANGYFDRARVYEVSKDFSSAIVDYQKYLEIGKGDRAKLEEVKEKIKNLKSKLAKKKSTEKKSK